MLDEKIILDLAMGSEAIASDLYAAIMRRIIKRFIKRMKDLTPNQFTGTDKWQIETLTEAGYLLEDIQADIAKATGLQEKEIAEAMEYAGVESFKADTKTYVAAGIIKPDEIVTLPNGQQMIVPAVDLSQSPQYVNIMQRNYEKTLGTWRNFTGTTATNAHKLFVAECDTAYSLVMSNGVSYTEAYVEAIKRMVTGGLTVEYRAGNRTRHDTIETATLRAVRTGAAQACGEVTARRMDDLGWDIVLVDAHMGARTGKNLDAANHAWWQGKFYSKNGTTRGLQPFSVCGFGTGEGLCGYNCRHSFGPGDGKNNPFDGLIDSKENARVYELSQKQRELERNIRKTRNECVELEAAMSASEGKERDAIAQIYGKRADKLQRQNKEYNAFCKENDVKRYDDRLKVARWNRAQSDAARKAANAYRKQQTG